MAKINKALDYNKLLQDQKSGKQLKKILQFPLYAGIKYDGNYVVALVDRGNIEFITSGGLNYTHTDEGGDIFKTMRDGAYLCERIHGLGLLGDRNKCNLRGPKTAQTSTGHSYKIFGVLSLEDYYDGISHTKYSDMINGMRDHIPKSSLADSIIIEDKQSLDVYLNNIVKQGYEGLMLMQPDYKWRDTTSRGIKLCKYKKRPTVDLLVIDTIDGTGKYLGMIGSLRLQDSQGRQVDVGSGMLDTDRLVDPKFYIGKVVEVFYEHIADTYIQPTFGSEYEGVLIREDKDRHGID